MAKKIRVNSHTRKGTKGVNTHWRNVVDARLEYVKGRGDQYMNREHDNAHEAMVQGGEYKGMYGDVLNEYLSYLKRVIQDVVPHYTPVALPKKATIGKIKLPSANKMD